MGVPMRPRVIDLLEKTGHFRGMLTITFREKQENRIPDERPRATDSESRRPLPLEGPRVFSVWGVGGLPQNILGIGSL